MTEQPTALRLAERLAVYLPKPQDMIDAAAELRRLHAQRDALLDALWVCMEHNLLHYGESHNTVIQARAAIKKAEENT